MKTLFAVRERIFKACEHIFKACERISAVLEHIFKPLEYIFTSFGQSSLILCHSFQCQLYALALYVYAEYFDTQLLMNGYYFVGI